MAKVIIMPIMGNKENFKIKIQGKFGNKFIVKPKVYEVIQENNDTTIKLVNTFDKTILVSGFQIADFEVEGNTYANIEDLTQAISIAVFKKGGGGAAEDLTQADVNNVKAWDYNSLNNLPNLNLKADLSPSTGKLLFSQLPDGLLPSILVVGASTVADLASVTNPQPNVIYELELAPNGAQREYRWYPSTSEWKPWGDQSDNLYISELHVDPINGDDTATGSINYPFKTLTNALVSVKAGQKIVLHTTVDALGNSMPYTGDYTLSTPNVTICSLTAESGAQTVLTGTLTVTSNTGENRINDVAINNVVHAGSAYLYIDDVLVNNDIVKNGTGELAINQCQVNNKIDINSSGTTSINGGWNNIINQYDANATINIYNVLKEGRSKKIFIQRGYININDSYIGTGVVDPGVPNSKFALLVDGLAKGVVLKNTTVVDTNGVDGSGLISIKANVPYAYYDSYFDKQNSELLGVKSDSESKFTSIETTILKLEQLDASILGTDSTGKVVSKTIQRSPKTVYVDPNIAIGNDTTGNGSEYAPFRTIAKALTLLGNTGEKLILSTGIYNESPTFTQLNLTIASKEPEVGGIVYIQGTATFNGNNANSSQRVSGLAIDNVVHQGLSRLYLDGVNVNQNFTKTGNASYLRFRFTEVNGTTSITGTGLVNIRDSNTPIVSVNNANAQVYLANSDGLNVFNLLAGVALLNNNTIIQPNDATPGLTTSSGSTLYMRNVGFGKINGAPGVINIASGTLYNIIGSTYDVALSTISATAVNIGTPTVTDHVQVKKGLTLEHVKNASVLKTDANGNVIAGTISGGGVQLGAIVSALYLSASDGYLELNGQSLSTTTYSDLYNYAVTNGLIDTGIRTSNGRFFRAATNSTTFSLPDLRGGFLRALDNRATGSLDTDRGTTSAVGSYQADQLVSHRHQIYTQYGKFGGGFNTGTLFEHWYADGGKMMNSEHAGGTETRPKNFAVRYYIKATLVVETGITSNTINSQIVSKDWMLGYSVANPIALTTSTTNITSLLTTPLYSENTPPITLTSGVFRVNNTETESYVIDTYVKFKPVHSGSGQHTITIFFINNTTNAELFTLDYAQFYDNAESNYMKNLNGKLRLTSTDIDKLKTDGFRIEAKITEGNNTINLNNFEVNFKRI